MAEPQTTVPEPREAWVRGHVLTRFFAFVWWLVMTVVSAVAAGSVIRLAVHRSGRDLVTVGIMALIFLPIGREWPNWRRMGRMLIHGT